MQFIPGQSRVPPLVQACMSILFSLSLWVSHFFNFIFVALPVLRCRSQDLIIIYRLYFKKVDLLHQVACIRLYLSSTDFFHCIYFKRASAVSSSFYIFFFVVMLSISYFRIRLCVCVVFSLLGFCCDKFIHSNNSINTAHLLVHVS